MNDSELEFFILKYLCEKHEKDGKNIFEFKEIQEIFPDESFETLDNILHIMHKNNLIVCMKVKKPYQYVCYLINDTVEYFKSLEK